MMNKILIVDDDASVRDSMKKVLLDEGYDVLLAADAQAAVEHCNPHGIDALLLDINLPGRGGWDLFERFTSQNPTLPIIIVTGVAGLHSVAAAAGVGALMEKPLNVPTLLRTIRLLLNEPQETRLRRVAGYGGTPRYSPPDVGRFLEQLEKQTCMPFRWRRLEAPAHRSTRDVP